MNESENSSSGKAAAPAEGFRISEQPVVGQVAPPRSAASELPASYGSDLLYVIARDPGTLFVYWDLNWTRAFAQAGLAAREVHLRIFREDGSIEGTLEINPFRGHCYAEVTSDSTTYYCELGCFEGGDWRSLLRSGRTATPAAAPSEDFSAEFATLPLHLSFQRLLEVFESNTSKSLAHSVAELQANSGNGISQNGGNGAPLAEIADLLEAARRAGAGPELTLEQRLRWNELTERLIDSGWGGAGENGLGGSSPA
ncbi:MAG TPA: DUF4912 domain-containing protein [Chthoniobacterales bacterium]